jgi:cytochrome b561
MNEAVNPANSVDIGLQQRASSHPTQVDSNYTRTSIFLHWLIALCIFGQILFGWYLEEIPRGTPDRSWFVNLHKSIGLTLGLLILFRLYWRLSHTPPALPNFIPAWQRIAANVSHSLLYACMLIMPISGYVASNFSKWGVKLFNVLTLPPWGVDDKSIYAFFNTTHVLTSYVLVTLISLHVIGALGHAVSRDGVFGRMWFRH